MERMLDGRDKLGVGALWMEKMRDGGCEKLRREIGEAMFAGDRVYAAILEKMRKVRV